MGGNEPDGGLGIYVISGGLEEEVATPTPTRVIDRSGHRSILTYSKDPY